MKSSLYHLQINIDPKNIGFYKDLMAFLGCSVIYADEEMAGFRSENKGDLWFVKAIKNEYGDYDQIGVNHISLRVESMADVDSVIEYLKTKNISMLFDTPKHRAEFTAEPNETYYQIMFETPDKILFEIVYLGPKN